VAIENNSKKHINDIMNLTFVYLTIIIIISTIIVVMDIHNTIAIYYAAKYIAPYSSSYSVIAVLDPVTITASTIVLFFEFIYSAFDINKVYLYFESNKYNDIIDQTSSYKDTILVLTLIVLIGIVMSIITFASLIVIFIYRFFFISIFILIIMLILYVILRNNLDKNIKKL